MIWYVLWIIWVDEHNFKKTESISILYYSVIKVKHLIMLRAAYNLTS